MQKPKKRKIPQSKKTRLNKLRKIAYGNPMQALYKTHLEQDSATINKLYPLEMTFCEEDARKVMDEFFIEYGFTVGQVGVVVPEFTVLKAYNFDDLIIALKMQQATCEEWDISVETHFYNLETHEQKTIPYFVSLSGVNYTEIYKELKIKVDRGAGVKTRWRGIEKELSKVYEEEGIEGFTQIRTNMHFVGQCKFVHIEAYDEFKYLQQQRDNGTIEGLFKEIYEKAIENGSYDEKLQPIVHTNSGLPINVFKEYYEKNKPVYF